MSDSMKCTCPNCRSVTGRVDHSFCPACRRAIKERETPMSDPMTDTEIEAIRARADAVKSDEPLLIRRGEYAAAQVFNSPLSLMAEFCACVTPGGKLIHESRAMFFAHAYRDIPRLLAEVERLKRREPTQNEANHLLGDLDEGYLDGGWTARRCRVCNKWVFGGPTACVLCVAKEEAQAEVARLRDENAKLRRRDDDDREQMEQYEEDMYGR